MKFGVRKLERSLCHNNSVKGAIVNRLRVDQECIRQTDGQTDRMAFSNMPSNVVRRALNMHFGRSIIVSVLPLYL